MKSATLSIFGYITLDGKYPEGTEITIDSPRNYIHDINGNIQEWKAVYINDNYVGDLHCLCFDENNPSSN